MLEHILLRCIAADLVKVRHLVLDIEESIRKAGEDAEMVFATLYTYLGKRFNEALCIF